MFKNISSFLLYNETRSFIQKNVLLISQVSFLQVVLAINDLIKGDPMAVLYDLPIFVVVGWVWWSIKYRGVYLSNLVFVLLVPLFSWIIFDSLKYGLINIVWSFPIIAALFFCFYKRMAWLATVIIIIVSTLSTIYYFSYMDAFRVSIALIMVSFCFIAAFSNVYQQYDFLKNEAIHDPLTGLLNRSSLEANILTSTHQTNKHIYPVLLCVDLDNFKQINDTFGHAKGDQVLVDTAGLFNGLLQKNDKTFRMGGEEFLILLSPTTIDKATQLAEQIRNGLESNDLLDNHTITASIGVAKYRQDENWEKWLKRADKAMYQAKHTGKNKTVVIE